jgi:hypothetical protein
MNIANAAFAKLLINALYEANVKVFMDYEAIVN